jgi:heterodisulfide reductase subunit B
LRYAYYPGCSLDATGIEYDTANKLVAKKLGMELVEIPDWNCCGATSAHSTNHLLALALPARNLAIAEAEGFETVAIPCAACFARCKKTAAAVQASSEMKNKICDIIEMDYQAKTEILSFLDVVGKKVGLKKIKAQVIHPLHGLKVAAYYGCLLVRPAAIMQSDDPENPMVMDHILESLGATVLDWDYKTECCGASHVVPVPNLGKNLIHDILKNAASHGAEAIATACPLCMLNLDMRQKQINALLGTDFHIPIFHFTELMALAFGYSGQDFGLAKHFEPAGELIARIVNPVARGEGE